LKVRNLLRFQRQLRFALEIHKMRPAPAVAGTKSLGDHLRAGHRKRGCVDLTLPPARCSAIRGFSRLAGHISRDHETAARWPARTLLYSIADNRRSLKQKIDVPVEPFGSAQVSGYACVESVHGAARIHIEPGGKPLRPEFACGDDFISVKPDERLVHAFSHRNPSPLHRGATAPSPLHCDPTAPSPPPLWRGLGGGPSRLARQRFRQTLQRTHSPKAETQRLGIRTPPQPSPRRGGSLS